MRRFMGGVSPVARVLRSLGRASLVEITDQRILEEIQARLETDGYREAGRSSFFTWKR